LAVDIHGLLGSGELDLVVEEGVLQCSLGSEPVLGVQSEAALEEVAEGVQEFGVFVEAAVAFEEALEFSFLGDGYLYLVDCVQLGVGVVVGVEEVEVGVEVLLIVLALLEHLDAEFAPALHDQLEHLVVRASLEQELPSEDLVQAAAHGPSVDAVALLWGHFAAQDDFRGAVVAGDQVLDVGGVLVDGEGSAEVCELDGVEVEGEEEVVGLDVCVDDPVLAEVVQTQEHGDGVVLDVLEGNAVLVLAGVAAQVWPHQLAHQEQVPFLVEVVVHSYHMLTLPQQGEHFELPLPTQHRGLVLAQDFQGHFAVLGVLVSCLGHNTEDASAYLVDDAVPVG